MSLARPIFAGQSSGWHGPVPDTHSNNVSLQPKKKGEKKPFRLVQTGHVLNNESYDTSWLAMTAVT